MDRETAAEIVLTLAADSVLTDEQVAEDEEILGPEQTKQETSIEIVRQMLNEVLHG